VETFQQYQAKQGKGKTATEEHQENQKDGQPNQQGQAK